MGLGIGGTEADPSIDPDFNYLNWWSHISPNRYDERMFGLNALPYNHDSFLLITAGKDDIFGTDDDVTNFERRD